MKALFNLPFETRALTCPLLRETGVVDGFVKNRKSGLLPPTTLSNHELVEWASKGRETGVVDGFKQKIGSSLVLGDQ